MARTTAPQKLERVLRFLVALREPDVALPLVAAGFTDDDLAEGWRLLRGTSIASIGDVEPNEGRLVRAAQTALEAWARRHIQLVEPAIERRFPAVHAFLYGGLGEWKGARVVLNVEHFLDRMRKLGKRASGPEARALLAARGLTDEALEATAAVLVRAKALGPRSKKKPPNWSTAEDAAWRWYLEWSKVARESIDDGRVKNRLRLMEREPTGA